MTGTLQRTNSMSEMDYGVVKIADDHDFQTLKDLVDNTDGWLLEFHKNQIKVWTKSVENSEFKMVKVTSIFSDVNSCDLYDVLHDPDYRKEWDHNMLEAIEIGYLNPNNDVSYYAVSVPIPLKNRDFVLQRSWLDTGNEQYIINHSVFHKDYPPRRGYVRAISHFTGYLIRKVQPGNKEDGCDFAYISRSDPQGILPSWLVNKCTQILAPKYVRLLETAALGYYKWKETHNPNYKPWHFPEQITSPKISLEDCVPSECEIQSNPSVRCFLVTKTALNVEPPAQKPERAQSLPREQHREMMPGQQKSMSLQSNIHQQGRSKISFMSCLKCTRGHDDS